jgi:hypothetical protein
MKNMSINWLLVTAEEGFNRILKLRNTHPDTLEADLKKAWLLAQK